MKTLYGFVLLSRPLNVLMVLFTGLAIKLGFMDEVSNSCGFQNTSFVNLGFGLLMAVLMILTASGNIINDYFDVRVDRINKPNRVVIDKLVKRRLAIVTHFFLNAVAVIGAGFLTFITGNIWLLIIPFGLSLAVWFYSSTFKKQFLTGNVLVALMVSTVPLLTGLYFIDNSMLHSETNIGNSECSEAAIQSMWGILIYTGFAFALTLIREIQKDLEDVPGDSSEGFKTLAIVLGNKATRRLVAFLTAVLIVILVIMGPPIISNATHTLWAWILFVGGILLPLGLSIYFSWQYKYDQTINKAQKMSKVAMLGGLLFLLLL